MTPTLPTLNQVKWYTPNDLLSYNKLFNFVILMRGPGKTVNTLLFLIRRFEKYGEQFVYMRRREVEREDATPTLFAKIKKLGYYQNVTLKADKKGNIYYNDKIMGRSVALSTVMSRKSIEMDNCLWIWYEEFTADGVKTRYLPNEAEDFLNFYETTARMDELNPDLKRTVRCLFTGNTFSIYNPMFDYLNIKLPMSPPYTTFYRGPDWVVQLQTDDSYLKAKQQTRIYKATEGSKFNQTSYHGDFYLDKTEFIRPIPKDCKYCFSFIVNNKLYSVYSDWRLGLYYCSTKGGDHNPYNTVALTQEDNRPSAVSIRAVKRTPAMREFMYAYGTNNVYYDKLSTYHALYNAIYLLHSY